jgi:hypothetical protein
VTNHKKLQNGKHQYYLKTERLTNSDIKNSTFKTLDDFYIEISKWIVEQNDPNIERLHNGTAELTVYIRGVNTNKTEELSKLLKKKQKGSELIKLLGDDFLIGQH